MAATKTISATLPIDIVNILDTISLERKRKKGEIIREALEMYFDEWEDYKIAINRLEDGDDIILGEEEFHKELREDYGWDI